MVKSKMLKQLFNQFMLLAKATAVSITTQVYGKLDALESYILHVLYGPNHYTMSANTLLSANQ